jgi:thiosulfate dehydrogenase (quinone) large subunit
MAERPPRRSDESVAHTGRVATAALVPLRVFLGGTFLYAGLDKLIDPTFLASSGPGSITDQLHAFARDSPLAFLINGVALHAPILVGLGMAALEIAIGLGTLAGWLFRLSAALGTTVALLFWLTASWATTPYFLGPDLPYAAGWLTLALAGDGGAWTLERWLAVRDARPKGGYSRAALRRQAPVSADRRRFLKMLGWAGATALIAGPSLVIGRLAASARPAATLANGASPTPTSAPPSNTASASASAAPTATPTSGSGTLLARGSQLTASTAVTATDPASGDPVLVIKLPSGSVVAYDAVCTHAGCTVEYDPASVTIFCPCHGAQFDPAHKAQVIAGPTLTPLPAIPIRVDPSSGDVTTTA